MKTIVEFCVRCKRKMSVAKIGQEVIELTSYKGRPYKHMSGDILECPDCGCQVVTRFGSVTMCHDEEFEKHVRGAGAIGYLEVF